jgi:dynein intermediate chain 1
LSEEFTRILNANNPRAAQNIARYIFKEKTFKATPNVEHHVVHFEFEGYLIYKEDRKDDFGDISAPLQETNVPSATAGTGPEVVEELDENGEVITKTVQKVVTKNQFNYSDRASQTINPNHKVSTKTKINCRIVSQILNHRHKRHLQLLLHNGRYLMLMSMMAN